MNRDTLAQGMAERVAEESARVEVVPATEDRPAAPSRPPSPTGCVVGGSGSARGLKSAGTSWCELGERDIKIFSFLELFGTAALGQIWAGFFKGVGKDTADWLFLDQPVVARGIFTRVYKRLLKLVSFGCLERNLHLYPQHMLFKLSSRGHWQLVKRGINKFSAPLEKWPKESELDHSLLLGTLALIFERCLGRTYKSEREMIRDYWLRSRTNGSWNKMRLPDLAIRKLRDQSSQLRVELELTLKSDKRYFDYWGSFGSASYGPAAFLIYIAGNAAVLNHLLKLAHKKRYEGIFFCDLASFKKSLGRCEFVNPLGGKCQLAAGSS